MMTGPKINLSGFEDDEDDDLGGILPPSRPSSRTQTDAAETTDQNEEAHDEADGAKTATTAKSGGGKQGTTKKATAGKKATTSKPRTTKRATSSKSRTAATGAEKDDDSTKRQPASATSTGIIESKTIYLTYANRGRLIERRDKRGLSNGDMIKAAIEQVYPQLQELLGTKATTTGTLFSTVPTAGATSSGPVTTGDKVPLNVRLYEADWAVIDNLVETFGARKRSVLVDTAVGAADLEKI